MKKLLKSLSLLSILMISLNTSIVLAEEVSTDDCSAIADERVIESTAGQLESAEAPSSEGIAD